MSRVVLLSAALALVCSTSAAASTSAGFVVGSGTGEVPAAFNFGVTGDTLRADVAAAGRGTSAVGGFHVAHRRPWGQIVGESWGVVDCVDVSRSAGGAVARVTGTIARGAAPGFGFADLRGERIALTITDGTEDSYLFDISVLHPPPPDAPPPTPKEIVPPCAQGVVPISVAPGSFLVRGA